MPSPICGTANAYMVTVGNAGGGRYTYNTC